MTRGYFGVAPCPHSFQFSSYVSAPFFSNDISLLPNNKCPLPPLRAHPVNLSDIPFHARARVISESFVGQRQVVAVFQRSTWDSLSVCPIVTGKICWDLRSYFVNKTPLEPNNVDIRGRYVRHKKWGIATLTIVHPTVSYCAILRDKTRVKHQRCVVHFGNTGYEPISA